MSIINKLKNFNVFSSKSAFDTQYANSPIPDTELSMAGCQVVVETYINGESGYIKWSDGRIEQWGIIPVSATTINFPIAFPNYCFHVNITVEYPSNQYGYEQLVAAATKTNFTVLLAAGSSMRRTFYALGN